MAKYFSEKEIRGLDEKFVELLDFAREVAGIPFVITEGLASGGSHVANTAHSRGLAVDLRVHDGLSRMKIIKSLLAVGFKRIGIYDRHVHVDIDDSLPQDVLWTGWSK